MKMFLGSLSNATSTINPPSLSELIISLTGGIDSASQTLYWFRPYLADDFPEITGVTKKYIFIYSSHHSTEGSFWGQGDNIDLSDFTESGYCGLKGSSAETPTLFRIPTGEGVDDNDLCLIYHPNSIPQQSRYYRSANPGSLSLTDMDNSGDWIFVDNLVDVGYVPDKILGLHTLANGNQIGGIDEGHTGYAMFRNRGYKDFEMRHMVLGKNADNNPTGNTIQRYSYSDDGLNWVRGEDLTDILINGIPWQVSVNKNPFFTIGGINYCFGIMMRDITPIGDYPLCMVRYDKDFRNPQIIEYYGIDCDDAYTYIDSGLLHIYLIPSREHPNHVVYTSLDVSNINIWDLPDLTDVDPPDGINLYEWVKAQDTEAPVITSALTFDNVSDKTVDLSITATDNIGVIGYDVFLSQAPNPTTYFKTLNYPILDNTELSGLYSGNTYYARVKAIDLVGNRSDYSNEITFTTL